MDGLPDRTNRTAPIKVKEVKPENYYSRNLHYLTIVMYVGLMLVIFLAFGYIRVKR